MLPKIILDIYNQPFGLMSITSTIIVVVCTWVIIVAVILDFLLFFKQKAPKKEKKSIVETGSMFFFFLAFYFLIKFQLGQFVVPNLFIHLAIVFPGIILIVVGCIFNVVGRFNLGRNWANQIKIYKDHSLINRGAYRIVQHPLYASLIWMFFGASLIYSNVFAFLLNILIFVPFMAYRAKQEEDLLMKEFPQYKNYEEKVGMFFPKISK